MRCPECGAENEPSARFCHSCDAALVILFDPRAEAAQRANGPDEGEVAATAAAYASHDLASGVGAADEGVGAARSAQVSLAERTRHMRVPTAPGAQSEGPVGLEGGERQPASREVRKASPLKRLLFVIINAAFILGISYLPWATVRYVGTGGSLTAPELSMTLFETVTSMISGSVGPTVNTAFAVGLLATAIWGSTIYCSAGDIYYDAVGRRRLHAGVVNAIVVSVVTVGGAYALNASATNPMTAVEALFDASATSLVTLSIWPPVMLGVALLALLVDLVVE